MPAQEYSVALPAYRKVVCHCLRYPSSNVYGNRLQTGALIGQAEFAIADAIPLAHSPPVNPAFSLALNLAEANLPPDHRILALYWSSSSDLPFPVEKSFHLPIFKVVVSQESIELVLPGRSGQKESLSKDMPSLSKDTPPTSPAPGAEPTESEPNQSEADSGSGRGVRHPPFHAVVEDIRAGKHRLIVDVDAHLECPSLDFRNLTL